MTAYVLKVGDGSVLSPNHAGGLHRVRVNIPKAILSLGIAGFSANDTLTFLEIPAGTFVRCIPAEVLVAEGATCTAGIGDADDATGYHSALNLNSAAKVRGINAMTEAAPNTFTGYTNGKHYAAEGALIMTFNHSTVNLAVADFYVCFEPCYGGPPV